MSHGGGGEGKATEPNLVPLLDMVMQLLMFFMISVNFVSEQVNESIQLPVAQSARPMDKTDTDVLFLNLAAFYKEVERISRPDARIALVTYELPYISDDVDAIVHTLALRTLRDYWPPERSYVNDRYGSLPFPFEEIHAPEIQMREVWDLDRFCAYIATWSGLRVAIESGREDLFDDVRSGLERVWRAPREQREVSWPLTIRLGKVSK